MERHFRRVKSHLRIAGRRDDASPVRVGPGDGRFYQRAVGDRAGDLPGVLLRLAAVDLDGDQVRGPFAVGRDRLGQVLAHLVERGPELGERLAPEHRPARRAVGQQQHRVVRAHVPVDADAVERIVHRVEQRRLGVFLVQRRVGKHQCQHRRHVRPDHRRALGDAGDRDRLLADLDHPTANLRDGVGGHHAAGRPLERAFVGAELGRELRQARANLLQRQLLADDARRHHQGLVGLYAAGFGRVSRHLSRVPVALFAGAGIGHAGIDRHAADAVARCAGPVEIHRRRADQILRVHAHAHGRPIGDHQRQIELVRNAFDARINAAGSKSLGEGGHAGWNDRVRVLVRLHKAATAGRGRTGNTAAYRHHRWRLYGKPSPLQ